VEAEALNRVLVHVQAHLDEDLALGRLAGVAGLSPFHFEREFSRQTGETVKQYTQRLRLERAAIRLLLHRGSILDIALDCGFQSHETFTRAFRRRFALAPREYRRRGLAPREHPRPPPRARAAPGTCFELSSTKLLELDDIHVAFLRHIGPYEEVSEKLWVELSAWARRRGVPEPFVLLGIGHDAPGITPPEKLRFDAAIRIPAPMKMAGRIGHQVLPGGTFAVTTHVGPYDTLWAAYSEIFTRLAGRDDCRIVGLPALEIYQTTVIQPRLLVNYTDIYLPVEKVAGGRRGAGAPRPKTSIG
jgi:AraC family transcriptional regulator